MLKGIGGLVAEGRVIGQLLAGERAVLIVLLRLVADDENGLALHVDPVIVVVVELQTSVVGRDAVTGEYDRHAFHRPADADGQRHELGFRSSAVSGLALGTVDDELLRLTKPGLAREAEFLKVTVRAGRWFQSQPAKGVCDVTRQTPRFPWCPALGPSRASAARYETSAFIRDLGGARGRCGHRLGGIRRSAASASARAWSLLN